MCVPPGVAVSRHTGPCEAALGRRSSCTAMVLFLDSLGQCVSALSKRFAAAESIRDTVSCVPHSHREKQSEVRHRKDTHHPQEEALDPQVGPTTPALNPHVCSDRSSLRVEDLALSSSAVSDAGNQWQSPRLHPKEAQSQLRAGRRTEPQAERRAESSIPGSRDHGTW